MELATLTEIWSERGDTNACTGKCKKTGKFLKGNKAWNKGMKGLNIGGKKTQFKKGNIPANSRMNGVMSERYHKRDKRTYLYIRISPGKWMLYNRYVWQKHHGEIPAKHVIIHKDKNTLNCNIENLECISMAENMRRNHNRRKAAKSLRKRWKQESLRKIYGMPQETKLRLK